MMLVALLGRMPRLAGLLGASHPYLLSCSYLSSISVSEVGVVSIGLDSYRGGGLVTEAMEKIALDWEYWWSLPNSAGHSK